MSGFAYGICAMFALLMIRAGFARVLDNGMDQTGRWRIPGCATAIAGLLGVAFVVSRLL